jgi:hypothetical protein
MGISHVSISTGKTGVAAGNQPMFFLIVLGSINNLGTNVEILAPIWNLYTQKKIVHSVQYPTRTTRNTAFSRGQITGYGSCG